MNDLLIHNAEEKLNKESDGITGNKEKAMMSNLLSLLSDFFAKVPIYLLHCNISDEAVLTAYNAVNYNEDK